MSLSFFTDNLVVATDADALSVEEDFVSGFEVSSDIAIVRLRPEGRMGYQGQVRPSRVRKLAQ